MNYDLAIIGAGPGGYVAAIRAAQLGANVILIEKDEVGGVCLNRGCIPTKAMIACSHALETVNRSEEFGVYLEKETAKIDFAKVQERKEKIVETLRSGIRKLLKGRKIEVLKGIARFSGAKSIDVGGTEIESKNTIIATGSTWIELPNLPTNGKSIVTSDDALDWTEVPGELLIVGGGVVGCEFACMMNTFGSKVTIVEAMPSILSPVERELSRLLIRSMKAKNIDIFTDTLVERAIDEGERVKVVLSNGEERFTDKVLVAVGRRPETSQLNLDAAGIELTDRGFINVNDRYQTNADGIYAIGDSIGGLMLAHVASAEGIAAVDGIFGKGEELNSNAIPAPIFTTPEIATVGMTSDELKDKGFEFKTGRFPYLASGKAQCDGDTTGQVVVHADANDGKLLGAHIIGHDATLLIAEAALAIRKGLTAKDLEDTVHAHPTLSETLAESAGDVYGTAIHKIGRTR